MGPVNPDTIDAVALSPAIEISRQDSVRRGLHLELFTVGYNSLEGVIALVSGFFAGSIALVGFGMDSLIEVASGGVLLWRLRRDVHAAGRERDERLALRLVGICFLALAAYVTAESVTSLVRREAPERSLPGIALAAVSLVVMPLLARAKRKVARSISSAALTADARQTDFCTVLSAILLIGLLANALAGWWWADPVAALAMAPAMVREGVNALRGKTCCHGCSS